MAEQDSPLSHIAQIVEQQGGAEIVVGLPSHNHAQTVGAVAAAIRQGLQDAFPGKKALIVNTDCGSTDGSMDQVAASARGEDEGASLVQAAVPAQSRDLPYHGILGKAQGLHLVLRVAKLAGARACLMLSPDLASASPDWVGSLCRPILEQGFDLAVPIYARHKFDGAITNAIVRPLVRSLYGRFMRQPMGGEYAFSAALVERYLGGNIWGTDLARIGIDIWTTTQAICGGFKLCQVHLGPKQQVLSGAPPDLGTVLTHVLGSLFEDMTRNAAVWQRIRGAQPIPVFGATSSDVSSTVSFDVAKLADSFRLGFRNLQELWSVVLPPATLLDLKRVAARPAEAFAIADDVWCRLVFDFALGYRMRSLNRSHLLGSFLPLYNGWLASFGREMRDASIAESERRLEQLCQAYEVQKPYLISRWRSPDRFNP
ncbi:MAG: glycosyl transferase family 2 [Deltaproteobacteria bacterium]|nr:glycosyl transferase family 2 [Deltaproteobacteria bacterium]